MMALDCNNKPIMNCKLTIYAPKIFSDIMSNHFSEYDIAASLDILKNEEQIRKAGESGGGASGELFMFSSDKRLILKTITTEEHTLFL